MHVESQGKIDAHCVIKNKCETHNKLQGIRYYHATAEQGFISYFYYQSSFWRRRDPIYVQYDGNHFCVLGLCDAMNVLFWKKTSSKTLI